MASTFRNLVLIALICALATSLSISHTAYQQRNAHRVRVQEVSHRQQTTTDDSSFATNIQSTIDTISSSVQPDVPSIIETKNLPTFAFSKNTCQSLSDDQKTTILGKVKSAKDSITSFKTGVTDEKVSSDADNSFRYLNVVEQLVNKNCDDITTYLLVGPTPYQTNIITDKAWILGGLTMDDVSKDYINRISNNNNVTNCGSNTPFWDGFKCISCSDPTPVFNIATGKCDVCPDGSIYDSATHSCKEGGPKNYKPNVAGQPHILVPDEAEEGALDKYMNTGK